MNNPDSPEFYLADFDTQIVEFINQHRDMLMESMTGLTEEEVRMSLVYSKTTLLGLIKHATFVEQVWFQEASTGKSREELGILESPDESFELTANDTIENVLACYRETIKVSQQIAKGLSPEDELTGNRRGSLSVRWVYLHLLRELAHHCGHADILREQILDARGSHISRG